MNEECSPPRLGLMREGQDGLATRFHLASSRLDVLIDDAFEMHVLINIVDPSVFVQKLHPVDPVSCHPRLLNVEDEFVKERIECWSFDLGIWQQEDSALEFE